MENWKTIFKLKHPYWNDFSKLKSAFDQTNRIEKFMRSLSGLSSLIQTQASVTQNFDSVCYLLEESVSLLRSINPNKSVDATAFASAISGLSLPMRCQSSENNFAENSTLSNTSAGMDGGNVSETKQDEFNSESTVEVSLESTASITSENSSANDVKDVPERLQVMKLFKEKEPHAVNELWELINTDPQLIRWVYSTEVIPNKIYSRTCRSWITSMVRPILRCLRDHFGDDIGAFILEIGKVTASSFKNICDGLETHPHPYTYKS